MAYDLVFIEPQNLTGTTGKSRDVGDHVFLANLPKKPDVFVFFYPGSDDTEAVEHQLRELGQQTGDNLFVNIASLADPDYRLAVSRFSIKRLPVIVVTAAAALAATPGGDTTFVRLDSPLLFADPTLLTRSVEQLFNLFLAGKIVEAVRRGWITSQRAVVTDVAARVWSIIKPVIAWLSERDISVELATGKIEVKASGEA